MWSICNENVHKVQGKQKIYFPKIPTAGNNSAWGPRWCIAGKVSVRIGWPID